MYFEGAAILTHNDRVPEKGQRGWGGGVRIRKQ